MLKRTTKLMIIIVVISVIFTGCNENKNKDKKGEIDAIAGEVEDKLDNTTEVKEINGQAEVSQGDGVSEQVDSKIDDEDKIVIDLSDEDVYEVLKQAAEDYDLNYFEYVTGYQDLQKYSLVFVSKYCEACRYFAPTAFQYINTEGATPMFYVSLDDESTHDFARGLGIEETPTIIVFEKDKETDRMVGTIGIEELIEKTK